MESWPSILPDPLRSGYRYQPDACVLRTQMDGKRRVRKLFTRQPYSFDITVRLSDTQLAIFDYFWQKKLDSGSKWFELPLSTGKGKETVTARFLIEPDVPTPSIIVVVDVVIVTSNIPDIIPSLSNALPLPLSLSQVNTNPPPAKVAPA